MANETVIELEFDPIFGTKAKKKLIKDSKEVGAKSGKEFSESFGDNLKRVGRELKTKLSDAAKSATKLSAAIAVVGTGVLFKKAIDESSKLENSLTGLRSVAGSFGISAQEITAQAQALAQDGLIPLENVTGSLKSLLVNFDGDMQKSISTFNALKNAAAFNRQAALGLGEAIEGASEGLKNDISNKVDNAGITKNLSILQKEYAASIGTTVGKLSEAQKAQAEYLGVTKEASIFQGDYNRLIQTFSGAMTGLKTSFNFLLASFGNIVTKSPAVIALINSISNEIRNLTAGIKETGKDGFKDIVLGAIEVASAFNKYILRPVTLIGNAFHLLGNIVNTWIDMALLGFGKVANAIIAILPDSLVSDRMKAMAEGFETAAFDNLAISLGNTAQSLKDLGNTETADAVESGIGRIQAAVTAATPAVQKFQKTVAKSGDGMTGLSNKAKQTAKTVNNAINMGIAKSATMGIQSLTKSLLLGEDGFKNFGKKMAGMLGDMATQLGTTLIFSGLGIEALKSLGGAAAIAAGAGLVALGTIMKSFAGGGGGADTGGGIGGGDAFGSAIADTPIEDELSEPAEPDTKVAITVQGDIFDSDETGVRIASILQEASLNQNVKVVGFA